LIAPLVAPHWVSCLTDQENPARAIQTNSRSWLSILPQARSRTSPSHDQAIRRKTRLRSRWGAAAGWRAVERERTPFPRSNALKLPDAPQPGDGI